MDNILIISKNDLRELLKEMIPAQETKVPERKEKVFMNTDEAVKYINGRGIQIAKSTLYKHTMDGTISFQRFAGRKLMFKSEDLNKWIEERLH